MHKLNKIIFYAYYEHKLGLLILVMTAMILAVTVFDEIPLDKDDLEWDYGYLEEVKADDRRPILYLVMYSKKYNVRRHFSSHGLMKDFYLKRKVEKDHYYDRDVLIGSAKNVWWDLVFDSPRLKGNSTRHLVYRGEVFLDIKDTSKYSLEVIPKFNMYVYTILTIINIPYAYFLLLLWISKSRRFD